VFASNVTVIEDFYESYFDVISAVSARHWWVTLRLIGVAKDRWDVLGADLILRGADPSRLSLSAWLDVLMIVILQNIKSERANSFLMQLEAPPPGEELPPEDMEMTADAFLAMG
jgi:hypothetical protein